MRVGRPARTDPGPGAIVSRASTDAPGVRLCHLYAAQEAIEDALRTLRARGEPVTSPGPSVAVCSMAGDVQRAPLQMAALLCESNAVQPRVLGVDAPVPEVARFTREIDARAVWVHVSRARAQDAPSALRALRDELPPTVEVMAAGPGIRVRRFSSFAGFEEWLRRPAAVGAVRA